MDRPILSLFDGVRPTSDYLPDAIAAHARLCQAIPKYAHGPVDLCELALTCLRDAEAQRDWPLVTAAIATLLHLRLEILRHMELANVPASLIHRLLDASRPIGASVGT